MVEQLPHRDRWARRIEPGQPVLNGVAKAHAVFADELEDDGGDERLRRALDREAVAGMGAALPVFGPTEGCFPGAGRCDGDRDRTRAAVRSELWSCRMYACR
jgi:hypothetical protein